MHLRKLVWKLFCRWPQRNIEKIHSSYNNIFRHIKSSYTIQSGLIKAICTTCTVNRTFNRGEYANVIISRLTCMYFEAWRKLHFANDTFTFIFLNKYDCAFWFRFHLSLFLMVSHTSNNYWFRQWLGAKLKHICVTCHHFFYSVPRRFKSSAIVVNLHRTIYGPW